MIGGIGFIFRDLNLVVGIGWLGDVVGIVFYMLFYWNWEILRYLFRKEFSFVSCGGCVKFGGVIEDCEGVCEL